ncbi:uncharacterized protein LOC120256383 [Dioscorea cayenensis subsp. rotundata]|uniref:Uncharacterized protein LOC120256383 n=1 Tax=Dioscorea cayennensis subsp. rotundata TaxID=55577 RepID=A0AB40AYW8_DIOCR|nr:uncharacterized protein LOC120256383 [Dioscorea cayenensis subsp. rotundata]
MILPLPLLRHNVPPSLLRCSARRSAHRQVLASLRGDQWKLSNIDPEAVQERLSSWLLKAQALLTDVAAPLVKQGQGKKAGKESDMEGVDGEEEIFVDSEMTVERMTPNGCLSFAAAVSIEQFGRMNGLTGRKMQRIFEALAPEHAQFDARSLVEYCCFRYLSRDSSDFHPGLKDPAFQRLIFLTMLAWEQPYSTGSDLQVDSENSSLQRRLVGKEAFVRIAPAVAGVADSSTAHHLFKALAGAENGISLSLWMTFIAELFKVHEGRKSYQTNDVMQKEQLLCIGSSRKRPVLKWEGNIAWPGNLTLTDSALYFEAIGLTGAKNIIRLDLKCHGSQVKKTKVGPLGSKLFDSAVSVSSGELSETWVLEFVDFGGEMRREVWHAFISEVISLYKFIREFGPVDGDPLIHQVYGAQKGKSRAIRSVANSIARLQSLQFIRRLAEDPAKLVQFSYLRNVPYGDVVLQTLAVNFWGGQLIRKFKQEGYLSTRWGIPEELSVSNIHIFDVDGSVYLRKWMRSPTWGTSASVTFWKNTSVKQGIILSKNHVVADLNLVERAALTCREKSWMVEKTQATIDAAMIKGIPSNIDLFKELMLPCVFVVKNFDKLRRWEEPRWTLSFLVFAYTTLVRNLLPYVFPSTLMLMGTAMLFLKGLKEQGRLGRSIGKVTIRDQPPSNTIQKIIALKEAMADMEDFLQRVNIFLLKVRTIILAGQPQITRDVALLLLCGSIVLLVIPFKYIFAFVLFDLFTRELEFRKEMVIRFMNLLKERWASVYAAPVIVLPYEDDKSNSETTIVKEGDQTNTDRIQRNSPKS